MQRNNKVFQNRDYLPNLASQIISSALEFVLYVKDVHEGKDQTIRTIRWERPVEGWLKLNTNGLSLGNLGLAAGGGVIRDGNSNSVVGFSRKIGITSSFMAEMWPLRDGLIICVNHSYSTVEVEIEVDAKAVIDVLANSGQSNNFILSILNDCKQLASQIPRIRSSHCYKEANRCVDFMARQGTHQNEDFCLFENPPMGLFDLLG